jgi:hypothetical protein
MIWNPLNKIQMKKKYKWIRRKYLWFPEFFNLEKQRIAVEDLDAIINLINVSIEKDIKAKGLCNLITNVYSGFQDEKADEILEKLAQLCNRSFVGFGFFLRPHTTYWWYSEKDRHMAKWYKPRLEFLNEVKELFGYN